MESPEAEATYEQLYQTTRTIWLAHLACVAVLVLVALFLRGVTAAPLQPPAEKLVLVVMGLLIAHQVGGSFIVYKHAMTSIYAQQGVNPDGEKSVWDGIQNPDAAAEGEPADRGGETAVDPARLRQVWRGKNNLLLVCYALSEATAVYGIVLTVLTHKIYYGFGFGLGAAVMMLVTPPSKARMWRAIRHDLQHAKAGGDGAEPLQPS